jgi:anthranilate/para-aminobenzoate synthase component I
VTPSTAEADLLPRARALREAGHRVALLDSPPGTEAARRSHLCLLGEPRLDEGPPAGGEHVCLATFDHGLALHDVDGRHAPDLGFELACFPVRARLTLDRHTGEVEHAGEVDRLQAPADPGPGAELAAEGRKLSPSRPAFEGMVREAQAYIEAGHSYQVNLSLRASTRLTGDATRLFDRLRRANPSPYQALVLAPEVELVSASPELLLEVEGDRLATRPIAGTRPRGARPAEDAALARELAADAKERAEHAMLVDLARNDLGRVAEPGSVRVTDETVIERYSHVMHLVSEVEARLASDATAWDAFEAIFPCGTVSGAPKRRSLEIIDELEPVSRGAYTGSLGLVTPERSTWNILIRTLVRQGERAHVQAGAGIVADSDPAREHAESLDKARALLEALDVDVNARAGAGGSP